MIAMSLDVGDLIIEPDASVKMREIGTNAFALLKRHAEGDRGDLQECPALEGEVIVSRYKYDEATFVVVTIPKESTVISLEKLEERRMKG